MDVLVGIILPVFGLVAFGYAATFTRIFDAAAGRGLSAFVFWFALPVMLFRSMATAEPPDLGAPAFLLAYYGGTALMFLLAVVAARRRRGDWRAMIGFGAAYGNTVLLGIPLVPLALGPEARVPLFLLISFHGALFFTIVTIAIESARGQGKSLALLPWRIVKSLLSNAILMAILGGLVFNLAGLELPHAVDRWAELVAGAAVPGALFSMGASLRSYRVAGALGPALAMVVGKLVVHPLLVAVLVLVVLDVPPVWAKTAILAAALPTGINVYLFAARYRVAEAESATAILLSTLLSVPSLAFVLRALGVG
jgi:predicted permease